MVSVKNFLLEAETKFAGNEEVMQKIRLAVRGDNAHEILGRIGSEEAGPLKGIAEYFAGVSEGNEVVADLMTGTHKSEAMSRVLRDSGKTTEQINQAKAALHTMRERAVGLFDEQLKGVKELAGKSAEHDVKKSFVDRFESKTTIPDTKEFSEWANEFKVTSETRRQLRDGKITPQAFAKKEEMAKQAKSVAADFKKATRSESSYSELMEQANKSVKRLGDLLDGRKLEKVEESLETAANAAEKARDFFASKAPEFETHLPKEFEATAALEEVMEHSIEVGKKAASAPKYTIAGSTHADKVAGKGAEAAKDLKGFAKVWSTGMGKAGVIGGGLAAAYLLSKALGGGNSQEAAR